MKQWMKKPPSVRTLVISATTMAQAKQVVCVFDLVGKNGDVYKLDRKIISWRLKTGARILNCGRTKRSRDC